VNWAGALIGVSIGFLLIVTYHATDFPRPIPLPWYDIVVSVLIGALIGGLASARSIAILCTVTAAIVAVLGFTSVMKSPVLSLIRRDSIPSERLDAVIVLSSNVSADSLLDPAAVERLLSGLAVFRDNGARLLVTTRSASSRSDRRMVSDADRRALIDLAADTARWHAVGPVHTTRDEAVATAALLLPLGQRRVAVVTSPLHTRRACAAFERVGFQVTCVPAAERLYSVYAFNGSTTRLHAIADWLYEELARLEYRLRGWIR
jgi:uncharacterized SAM-binding protein YcdF (DUF218 family)